MNTLFGRAPEPAELRQLPAIPHALRTNLHVHLPPNFGSIASVAEAVRQAQQEQIAVLGASNYYDHTIYTAFAQAAVQVGIAPVFGIEVLTMDEALRKAGIRINDPKNPGKWYLCGKGLTNFDFDAIADDTAKIWNIIREGDKQRIQDMIAKINALDLLQQQGIQLSYAAIAQAIAAEKQVAAETVFLQERHLAQALQRAIFEQFAPAERAAFLQQLYQADEAVETQDVVTAQNALRSYLLKQGRAAYVDERFVSPEDAAALILGLGGYVSAPILIDGAPEILPGEGSPEELTANLLHRQIGAAEFIPNRNDRDVLTRYVRTLREAAIVVGAGTEHNAAAWIPLMPQCKPAVPLSDELIATFWEGACVAVAHQYQRAKGQPGFRFLADRDDREAQIQDMARLGAQVIAFFRNAAAS